MSRIVCSRSLVTSLALAGTLLGAAVAEAAPVRIPVAQPLDIGTSVGAVNLRDTFGGAVQSACDLVNNLLDIPRVGRMGYFWLDGGLWTWLGVWIHDDSMGTFASVGAWANVYADIAGHTTGWLKGYSVNAQAWLYRTPNYDPTMTCPTCTSSPWTAEVFVDHEEHIGDRHIPTRMWTESAPASIVKTAYEPLSIPIVHEHFSKDFGLFGSLSVSADLALEMTAQGEFSASPDGVEAKVDGMTNASMHLFASGFTGTCLPGLGCGAALGYAAADIDVLRNELWDENGDGRLDDADLAGKTNPEVARAHVQANIGERRLNLDDPTHPKVDLCAGGDGFVWIQGALKGSAGYNGGFARDGYYVDSIHDYVSFPGLPRKRVDQPVGGCAHLDSYF